MTKPINIQDLLPLLRDGWVAMNSNHNWYWFIRKPKIMKYNPIRWTMLKESPYNRLSLSAFNIAPVEDWTQSLIEVKNER